MLEENSLKFSTAKWEWPYSWHDRAPYGRSPASFLSSPSDKTDKVTDHFIPLWISWFYISSYSNMPKLLDKRSIRTWQISSLIRPSKTNLVFSPICCQVIPNFSCFPLQFNAGLSDHGGLKTWHYAPYTPNNLISRYLWDPVFGPQWISFT